MMNGTLGEWVDIIYKVAFAIFSIWLYLDRRNDKTHLRISKLETEIDGKLDVFGERLVRVEMDLKNAPNHNDLAELYREMRKQSETMTVMNSLLAAQSATLAALKDQVSRMDSFWRSKS